MIHNSELLANAFLMIALISWTTCEDQSHNMKILFPTSSKIEWHDVSPSNLICSTARIHQNIAHGLSFVVNRPVIGKDPKISGTLCVAIELTTTCSKGFFGGVDVTLSTSPADLSEENCRKEIASQNQGEFSSAEHPQPVCSWMKTSSTSRTVIHLSKMDAHYDPYSDTLFSSIFLSGKCRASFCQTVFENRLWIPQESLTEYCSTEHLVESSMMIYNSSSNGSSLWSPDFDISEEEKPCIMNFCGQKGLRFASGEWVALSRQSIPKAPWVGEHFYHLKDCDGHTTVNLVEAHQDLRHMTKVVLEEFIDEQCEMTVNKLKEGNMISRIELQTLYPRTPGFHPIYRYTQGKFLMGMAHYSWVSIESSEIFPYISIRSSLNKSIEYSYWTMDNRTQIIDGPNGLYILDHQLIYGLEEEQKFRRILSKSSKHVFPILPEQKTNGQSFVRLLSHTSYSFSDDASLVDVIWHPVLTCLIITAILLPSMIGIIWCTKNQVFIKELKSFAQRDVEPSEDISEAEGEYFNP